MSNTNMDSNFSIGRILLLLYVLISSSYFTDIFSNGFKKEIENNKFIQHILLIILVMVLFILFGQSYTMKFTNNREFNILIMTLLIYAWFILLARLDFSWNFGVIILLSIYFLFESKKESDNNIILNDVNLSSSAKKQIMDYYVNLQNLLLVGLLGITFVGNIFYYKKKTVQYGSGFSKSKFIFGSV